MCSGSRAEMINIGVLYKIWISKVSAIPQESISSGMREIQVELYESDRALQSRIV
jgi:hypothetical protein